jgi:hypothetical protein
MNIEQGVYNGGIYVVADIPARDSITPIVGDQAYVISKEDSEWGLYQYTGVEWVEIASKDSAATDARTLRGVYSFPAVGGPVSVLNLGDMSPGRKVIEVTVDVVEPVANYTTPPTLTVGFSTDHDALMRNSVLDLESVGKYQVSSEYIYPESNTNDLILSSYLTHGDATEGNVIVRVTYV